MNEKERSYTKQEGKILAFLLYLLLRCNNKSVYVVT